jgi:hypothetical protein
VAWNLAALAGWSPDDADLAGAQVFWAAVAAGLVLVPLGVLVLLGATSAYNVVGAHAGGIQIAVVSPRWRPPHDGR